MKRFISIVMLGLLLAASALAAGCSAVPAAQPTAVSSGDQTSPSVSQEAQSAVEPSDEASAPESSADSIWTVMNSIKIEHPTNMAGFLSKDIGFTVGYSGEVHYTSDAGQTWPEGENSSMCLFCLDIIDANTVWAAGNGYNVRVSHDGGKTWEAASDISLGGMPSNIDFIDESTGWIATQSKFASTNDGASTWTEMALPEGAESIAAISLRTAQDGYLLTREGQLFITADGGATWTGQDLGLKDYSIIDLQQQPRLGKSNMAVADMSFADEKNGTIVLSGMSSKGGFIAWCLTTADGGATWQAEQIPDLGFSVTKVFLTTDGQYLTMASNDNKTALLERQK